MTTDQLTAALSERGRDQATEAKALIRRDFHRNPLACLDLAKRLERPESLREVGSDVLATVADLALITLVEIVVEGT